MSNDNHEEVARSPDVAELTLDELAPRSWPCPTSRREARFQVVIRQSVLNDIHAHAHSSLNAEICGVIVGDACRDDCGPFLYIEGNIKGEFAASEIAGVTFTAETWAYMQGVLEKEYPGKRIVGWYHSHPDFGVFLSEMDLFIHRHFFNLSWQVAFVHDPIRLDDGMFVWRDGAPVREAIVVEEDAKIAIVQTPIRSEPKTTITLQTPKQFNQELLGLRRKVRWLTAGVVFSLVLSLVWPVVLIAVSQRTPWIGDLARSFVGPEDPSKAPATEPDQSRRQSQEHQRAPRSTQPVLSLPAHNRSDPAALHARPARESPRPAPGQPRHE